MATTLYKSKLQINDTIIAFKDATLGSTVLALGTVVTELSDTVDNLSGENIPIEPHGSTIVQWLNEHDEVIAYALNDLNTRIGDGYTVDERIAEAITGNNGDYVAKSSIIVPDEYTNLEPDSDIILATIAGTPIKVHTANETDENVKQTLTSESNDLPIIVKKSTTTAETTTGVSFSNTLSYNPATKTLKAGSGSIFASGVYGTVANFGTVNIGTLTIGNTVNSISNSSTETSTSALLTAKAVEDKVTGKLNSYVTKTSVQFPTNGTKISYGVTTIIGTVGATPLKIEIDSDENDFNVQQAQITTAGAMPIIIKTASSTSTATTTVGFNGDFTYNPSTKVLIVPNANISSVATITTAKINTLNATTGNISTVNSSVVNSTTVNASTNNVNTTNSTTLNVTGTGNIKGINATIINGSTITTGTLTIGSTITSISNSSTETSTSALLTAKSIEDKVTGKLNSYVTKASVVIPAATQNLAHNTDYIIATIAGTGVKVKIVSDNTDYKVQHSQVTSGGALPIIIKSSSSTSTATTTVGFNGDFTYDPGAKILKAPNANISSVATITTANITTGNITTGNITTGNFTTTKITNASVVNLSVTTIAATNARISIATISTGYIPTVFASTIYASSIPGYVTEDDLKLTSNYTKSASSNADLNLKPLDTYQTAFSKLHKAILDNEETIAAALIDINDRIGDGYTVDEKIAEAITGNNRDYVASSDIQIPNATPVGVHDSDIILATIGASSIKLHLPEDNDSKVNQASTTTSGSFPIILKKTANNTNTTDGVLYGTNLTFNPNSQTLQVTNATFTNATTNNLKATTGNINTLTVNTLNNNAIGQYVVSSDITVANPHATLTWGAVTTVGTVKGKAFKVKMPANPNTDYKVQQDPSTTDAALPIIIKTSSAVTAATTTVAFKSGFTYNPKSDVLSVPTATITNATVNNLKATTGNINTLTVNTLNNNAIGQYVVSSDIVAPNPHATLEWGATTIIGTVKGKVFKVKMPANPDIDTKVTQSSTTTSGSFPIILKRTANNTNTTDGVLYGVSLTYNPSTNILSVPNANISTVATITTANITTTNVTTANVTTGNVTNLKSTYATIANAWVTTIIGTNAKFTNGTVTNLWSTTANITTLNGSSVSDYVKSGDVTVANPHATLDWGAVTTIGTVKGKAFKVKMPGLPTDLNDKVSQASTTTSSAFPILLKKTANNTNTTDGVLYGVSLTYNPNTNILAVPNANISTVATITTANITTANVTTSNVTNLKSTNATIANAWVTTIIGTNAKFTNGTIINFWSTSANIGTLNSVAVSDYVKSSDVTVANPHATLTWGAVTTVGTVKGKAFKVKMPADPNTDYRVQQVPIATNAAYPIIFKGLSAVASVTGTTAFKSNLTYNPSTNILAVPNANINTVATITTANITTVNATTGNISTVSGTKLTYTNATIISGTTGTFVATSLLKGSTITGTVINGKTINATVINTATIITDVLKSTNASITTLTATTGTIINLTASSLTATSLNTQNIHFNIATGDTLTASTINASSIPGFAKIEDLVLGSTYEMSELVNDDLNLLPLDTYETAFGKIHKAIIDNEQIITAALIDLNTNKLDRRELILSETYAMSTAINENLELFPSDSYEVAFSKLHKAIIDDEEITSAAINELNDNKVESSQLHNLIQQELFLTPVYEMSTLSNASLNLEPNDSYETAFSKLHKAIIDDEQAISMSIFDLYDTKLSKVDTIATIDTIYATTLNVASIEGFISDNDVKVPESTPILNWNSTITVATIGATPIKITTLATPSDINVQQSQITTAGAMPIIIKTSTSTATATTNVGFNGDFTYNPSTKLLSVQNATITNASVITLNGTAIGNYVRKVDVTGGTPSLSWGATSQIGVVGGKSFAVKMPANPNTDKSVEQVPNSTNAAMPVIFKSAAATATATTNVSFKTGFTFNPNSNTLTVPNISITNLNGSAVTDYVKSGDISVGTPALSWGATSQIGTVKGKSFGVKLPANPNTDKAVEQVPNSTNAAMPIIFKSASAVATATTNVSFKSGFTFNPNSNTLSVTNATITNLNGSAVTDYVKTVDVTGGTPALSWGATSQIGIVKGKSFGVKLPANPNTDYKVQQDPSTTNAALPILLKTNANTTSATTTVVFKTNLSYNPSSNILSVPNATITTATVTTAKITTGNITTENSSTINASTINASSIPGFAKTNELSLGSTYAMSILSGTALEPQPNESFEIAIGKLHKSIIDFEYVVAAALNDINARLNKLNI